MVKEFNNRDVGLSRFISLILRHKPHSVGITLDEFGWANVEDLINGVCECGKKIDMQTLNRIVDENNKQRYSFNEDNTKIRANQGHSVDVNIEFEEKIPPQYLYHGTSERSSASIMDLGIQKQNRQYVHLSLDIKTAYAVGKRHGKPIIMRIDAEKMHEDGFKFYLSKNMVWLVDFVSVGYVSIETDISE
ncbi:RNA 2'-phosphotransferase [Clostridium sp. FP2]|uniref:RNA 2'-phosphotransferase n=1 Tax=Clostridium sp. FP2 TaxID=2724481 RepID=UPI0013E924F8|nr:RNA 2'-phosphotransferase [Clostridium sp. FP2]MBZ9624428.1 RNA 2'-phosphotransferase [Clostridium sp. FP2]